MYIYIYTYIYIFLKFLLKTLSQKFGYLLKIVIFMYIPWIVMFLGFINTKICNISYSHSAFFIPLLLYQLLSFLEKIVSTPMF